MFPIRDHNPSSRTPWVTYTLIATNVASVGKTHRDRIASFRVSLGAVDQGGSLGGLDQT